MMATFGVVVVVVSPCYFVNLRMQKMVVVVAPEFDDCCGEVTSEQY